MTAKRRLLPRDQIRDTLDLLRDYGIDLGQCVIDIGPDRVKVSPPANQNTGGNLGDFINRAPHNPKAGKGR